MKNIIEIKEDFEVPGTDIMLEKGDKIEVITEKDYNFLNVNIGVHRDETDIIAEIEDELDIMGVYFDNDGGDDDTYNINAGFNDRDAGYRFAKKWDKSVYVDTESFVVDEEKKRSTEVVTEKNIPLSKSNKSLKEYSSKYWKGDAEAGRIWDKYIPAQGNADHLETEIFLAANRVIYDWYNNGWGANNKTGELEFLQKYGYFKKVSDEDLAYGEGDKHERYMDDEFDKIIAEVQRAEKEGFKPLPNQLFTDMGISMNAWDELVYPEEEDEDDYYSNDDDEYEPHEFD